MAADKTNKIFANYELGKSIGTGRFAEVFEAIKRDLGQKVALKILRPEWNDNNTVREQFMKQARAIARLKHARVVDVLDLGEESGRTYMALEFLSGGDLANWQKSFENKHHPLLQIVTIIEDVASALDFLHSHKENGVPLVHGDVKPGNILLEEDLLASGRLHAKLSDLGMLYAMQKATTGTTIYPQSAPWYISPEQANDQPPTPLSDQYALGVVAYELLAGRVPFTAESVTTVYRLHKNEAPQAPSKFNPDLPEEIDKILLRVLSKDPASRYSDCTSFAKSLRLAVEATEEKKFRSLLDHARGDLAAGNPEAAINALAEARRIKPDALDVNNLMEKAQKVERAVQNYQEASDLFRSAKQQAEKIRSETPDYPDKDHLLAELAPLPPNRWLTSIHYWRRAMFTFAGLVLLLILGGFSGKIYTELKPEDDPFRVALVPVVWTDTATPTLTPTSTLTYTPTLTFTPTFTPTNTGTPTPPKLQSDFRTPIASLKTLLGHKDRVWTVTFSPDGSLLASGSSDNTVRIWNVDDGQSLQTLNGHSAVVTGVTFSPDGSRLASSSEDGTIRFWNVSSGQLLQTITGNTKYLTSISFSADGVLLASGSDSGNIYIWDSRSGQLMKTLQGTSTGSTWVWTVVFSPDGSLLASGANDGTIRIWNVSTGELLQNLKAGSYWIWSVAFSPDGSLLASGSGDNDTRIWNVNDGKLLQVLGGHTSSVRGVAFSPDGSLLASGSDDRTIQISSVKNGKILDTLRGHAGSAWSVAFSPDGWWLASGSDDRKIILWGIPRWNTVLTPTPTLTPTITLSPTATLPATSTPITPTLTPTSTPSFTQTP